MIDFDMIVIVYFNIIFKILALSYEIIHCVFVLVVNEIFQLARRLHESLVDIHLDPILHEACATDVQRLCRDIPPGQSRSMNFFYSNK